MNTKKIIAVILALAAVITVFAACSNSKEDSSSSQYESSEAILNTVWDKFAEDEKFAAVGGDAENSVSDKAGKFNIKDTDTLTVTYAFPSSQLENIDEAATLMNMMNSNSFTAIAFHITEGADMNAIAEDYKTSLTEKHWMCGMPDGFAIIKVDSEYMIAVFAQTSLEPFKTYAAEVLTGSEVLIADSLI